MKQIKYVIWVVMAVFCSMNMIAESRNEGRNVSESNDVCYITINEEDEASCEFIDKRYVLLFHVKNNTNSTFIQMNYRPANQQTAKRVSAGSKQIRKTNDSPREFYKEFLKELFGVEDLTYELKKQ